jgi:hypothetical protein
MASCSFLPLRGLPFGAAYLYVMRQDPMRRCRRSASRGVCVRSPAITVEIIARNHQLSLHSYGFASKAHRCCRNASSRFSPGHHRCISGMRSSPRLAGRRCFAIDRAACSSSYACRGFIVVGLCRPPCPAQRLRARARRRMQSSAAPSMRLRITRRSRRHLPAGRTWHHVHSCLVRPAGSCASPLRYAPGSNARVFVRRHARHIAFDHRRSTRAGQAS